MFDYNARFQLQDGAGARPTQTSEAVMIEAAIGYLFDIWHLLVVGGLLTLVGFADRVIAKLR